MPDSRIVCVDNDPIVLAHARALLTSSPAGETAYIGADLRDTPAILAEAGLTSTHRWRPGPGEPDTENDWPVRSGVARKP
jgi:hypothetical protein